MHERPFLEGKQKVSLIAVFLPVLWAALLVAWLWTGADLGPAGPLAYVPVG